MGFITYINNRFQELAVSIAKDGQENKFSILKDGEQNALKAILFMYRCVIATVYVPLIFAGFAMVLVRVKKKPLPELDRLKAAHDVGVNARQRKAARKVGFAPAPKLPENYAKDF